LKTTMKAIIAQASVHRRFQISSGRNSSGVDLKVNASASHAPEATAAPRERA